jgi:hypothetical protein
VHKKVYKNLFKHFIIFLIILSKITLNFMYIYVKILYLSYKSDVLGTSLTLSP